MKGFTIKILFISLLITFELFGNAYKFQQLEEEKTELINKYEIRVEVARIDRFYKRVAVLNKTLQCFKSARSPREIKACKLDERKRIMKIIRG